MTERKGAITFKGNPLTLLGDEPKIGQKAPDFAALGNDLSEVRLSSLAGKVVVISAVPSLDTPVCNVETRRFNTEAGKLAGQVTVVTISTDLPFAQKRWCQEAGATHIVTLSDHRSGEFGMKYGVLIKELRLLARSIFIVGRDGRLMYQQLVREVAQEPDYDEVLDAVRALTEKEPAKAR